MPKSISFEKSLKSSVFYLRLSAFICGLLSLIRIYARGLSNKQLATNNSFHARRAVQQTTVFMPKGLYNYQPQMTSENIDQQHPQESRDRAIVDRLLQEERSDYLLCELARLRIRYCGFPGAREIQKNLDTILLRWKMTEEQLFELTRSLHSSSQFYRHGGASQGQDDWN